MLEKKKKERERKGMIDRDEFLAKKKIDRDE